MIYESYQAAVFPEVNPSQAEWFALRVRATCQRATVLQLRQKGYPVFTPSYMARGVWSDRLKLTERPLFPGYIFSAFDAKRRLPILMTPGVLHIVGSGKEPIPIDLNELQALERALKSGLLIKPWPFLRVGQRVLVERGPLLGVEGFIHQLKGSSRLIISISLLQRSIAAEVDASWIRPLIDDSPSFGRSTGTYQTRVPKYTDSTEAGRLCQS